MNTRSFQGSRSQDEGERPFWISYADLMTALMILFLVVMVTSLSQITKKVSIVDETKSKATPVYSTVTAEAGKREEEIGGICKELSSQASKANPNISVDCALNRISFGEAGQFKTGEYQLGREGQKAIHDLLPVMLETATSEAARKWLKQVVIEGFTDTDGSYLYNLNLSLRRSEWVMCAILGHAGSEVIHLDNEQRKQIKQLFLAGGVSFNNIRDSKDASRRVELRLQFYGLGEPATANVFHDQKFEDSSNERCHI